MTPTRNCCMSLGMVLLLTASISRAEVRLETRSGDEPEVAVIVTPQGPWSPTSAVTSVVLNPDGDLSGDGQRQCQREARTEDEGRERSMVHIFVRLSNSALTATTSVLPDIESAATSGLSTNGYKTPAASGNAIAL